MTSPHVAGAAALLATVNNPNNETDVFNIRSKLISEGNFDWDNSDDGDSIKEPLLDVSDTTVFAPVLVAGTESSGGGEGDGGTSDTTAPTNVAVTEPAANSTVSGTVTMATTASDDVGVTKVEFFANAAKIGEDVTAPTDGRSAGILRPWSTAPTR